MNAGEKSIFARRLSRKEKNKMVHAIFVGCVVISLNLCIFFILLKPYLRLPTICKSTKGVSTSAVEGILIIDETTGNYSHKSVGNSTMLNNAAQDKLKVNQGNRITQPIVMPSQNLEPNIPQTEIKKIEPLCRVLKSDADYCEIEGDVRVNSSSLTVFLIRPHHAVPQSNITSWIIQPYPRRGIENAKNWTITLAADNNNNIPKCSKNHTLPALLFSIGGFSGNHFHDFADLIIPLYTTSFQFKREVHFLVSDYNLDWPAKFHQIINRLTKHGLLDIDREKHVNCYSKMIAGLQFHKELIIDPSFNPSSGVSMNQFRQLIRETYSLERTKAIKPKKYPQIKPRLMIISRKITRIITNEVEVSRVARKLGYEVVLAEGETSTNLTKFAELVNSCDVMMGVHGAGLTNMVFLPDSAVLIQVVPLGVFDGLAKLDFGNPAPGMNIRYLEYKIGMKESSLIQKYHVDHPFIKDPLSFHWKVWSQWSAIYLHNQNITIDSRRFKDTLAEALKLLHH